MTQHQITTVQRDTDPTLQTRVVLQVIPAAVRRSLDQAPLLCGFSREARAITEGDILAPLTARLQNHLADRTDGEAVRATTVATYIRESMRLVPCLSMLVRDLWSGLAETVVDHVMRLIQTGVEHGTATGTNQMSSDWILGYTHAVAELVRLNHQNGDWTETLLATNNLTRISCEQAGVCSQDLEILFPADREQTD